MTIDQLARESAAAVRAARAEAEFTSAPPGGRGPRRSRVGIAAAGALAVLLLVGIPAALLVRDRGAEPEPSGPALTSDAAQPGPQPAAADPTRSVRQPTDAELDTGIRYLRSYAVSSGPGPESLYATEQWLHPNGEAVGLARASEPQRSDGELVIDVAAADALLDAAEPVGDRAAEGVVPFGFADRTLPSEPSALEAALTAGPGQGGPLFSVGEALTPDGSGLDRRGLILRAAPLIAPVLDPSVAAAYYELVAGLKGAVVTEDATDPLGRRAIEVAVPVPMFDGTGAEVGRLAYVTWFEVDAKLLAGQRSELTSGAFPFSGAEGPIARLYVIAERGVVDEMPPLPEPPPEPVGGAGQGSPSTTVADSDLNVVAADGSVFGSSQLDAANPGLLALGRGNLECAEDCRSIDGPRTLQLTIDPVLQSELEPYMTADAYPGQDGSAALVMVMDSATGAVRAVAGDADAVERGLLGTSFDTGASPDAALLPVVLAIAIDGGLAPDATITPAGDCGSQPAMTLAEALATASDAALCQLRGELGDDRLVTAGRLLSGVPSAETVSVADVAAMFAVIANGGTLPHPHVVSAIESASGEPLGTQLYDHHTVLDPAAGNAVAVALDGLPGYGDGTWHAGSSGGVTVVVWDELGTGPAADVWATAMELASAF